MKFKMPSKFAIAAGIIGLIGGMITDTANEMKLEEKVNKAVEKKMAASKKEEEKEEGS